MKNELKNELKNEELAKVTGGRSTNGEDDSKIKPSKIGGYANQYEQYDTNVQTKTCPYELSSAGASCTTVNGGRSCEKLTLKYMKVGDPMKTCECSVYNDIIQVSM